MAERNEINPRILGEPLYTKEDGVKIFPREDSVEASSGPQAGLSPWEQEQARTEEKRLERDYEDARQSGAKFSLSQLRLPGFAELRLVSNEVSKESRLTGVSKEGII